MNTYLIHHGVKGQKWGVRRFQNEDGSLTSLGSRRRRGSIKDDVGKILFPTRNRDKSNTWANHTPTLKERRSNGPWNERPSERKRNGNFFGPASISKEERKKAAYEKKRETALKSKDPKKVLKNADTLSDKELRDKLNRLQMEQNLRDLSNKNTSYGKRFMKDMGNQLAKTAVTTLVITPVIMAVKKSLENSGAYNFDVVGPAGGVIKELI